MGKVWIFRETGEVRSLKRGEWFQETITGEFCHVYSDYNIRPPFPVITLEVIDHDPLEPIREVYEKYRGCRFGDYSEANELWQAIKKAVGGEGK